jgi:hypothetical protein
LKCPCVFSHNNSLQFDQSTDIGMAISCTPKEEKSSQDCHQNSLILWQKIFLLMVNCGTSICNPHHIIFSGVVIVASLPSFQLSTWKTFHKYRMKLRSKYLIATFHPNHIYISVGFFSVFTHLPPIIAIFLTLLKIHDLQFFNHFNYTHNHKWWNQLNVKENHTSMRYWKESFQKEEREWSWGTQNWVMGYIELNHFLKSKVWPSFHFPLAPLSPLTLTLTHSHSTLTLTLSLSHSLAPHTHSLSSLFLSGKINFETRNTENVRHLWLENKKNISHWFANCMFSIHV